MTRGIGKGESGEDLYFGPRCGLADVVGHSDPPTPHATTTASVDSAVAAGRAANDPDSSSQ